MRVGNCAWDTTSKVGVALPGGLPRVISANQGWLKTSETLCYPTMSCLALCDPMDCSLPGSSVHGISQVRILEWVEISSSGRSSWHRNRTRISRIGSRIPCWLSHQGIPNIFYQMPDLPTLWRSSTLLATCDQRWDQRWDQHETNMSPGLTCCSFFGTTLPGHPHGSRTSWIDHAFTAVLLVQTLETVCPGFSDQQRVLGGSIETCVQKYPSKS